MRSSPETLPTSPEDGWGLDEEILLVWPRLTRFYGIGPVELVRIPRTILDAYADAVGPLRAEEQIAALEASAYPHLKKSDARGVARRSEREASGWRRLLRRSHDRTPAGTTEGDLAAAAGRIGIPVEFVPGPDFVEHAEPEAEEEVT